MDLVFKDVRIEGEPAPVDIAVQDGRIAALGVDLPYAETTGIGRPVSGMLVSPLFIDPHHHLDCAYLDEYVNESGTLEEAIRINAEIKETRPAKEIREKACLALEHALLNGTGWIRSHVDIDSVSKLDLLHPLLEAKERFEGRVDVQVVTFPQLGMVRDPETPQWMQEALRQGADVVGGMPHCEPSREDAARHIDLAFKIAQAFDADIDMHVDETDDPEVRTLELLAEATIREGYQGRVSAGHCCALAAYEDDYAQRVIEKVAEAGITVITNSLVNLYLQA